VKQILQDLRAGATYVTDVPCPAAGPGMVLVASSHTLVSAGTERMLVEFGKAGLISKARQQPDKVKQVLRKLKTDGVAVTVETVLTKLGQPVPLGYCNVGTVVEVGAGVTDFKVGQKVISNGKHAELVSVPKNLCAAVPEGVPDEVASFTVLASIALQSIRLAQPTMGERVAVFGLGIIGLLTVQLLKAHGCQVLGLDFDPAKLALAEKFGAKTCNLASGADPLAAAAEFTGHRGIDFAIIAAATTSNDPVKHAAQMCRKRGRIILVGVAGLELSRADFYEKELSFQVSCSYGPGRYDPNYEEKGQDYPIGFVRWTEQRNFEAILDLMAEGKLDIEALISHRFAIDDAEKAYELVSGSEPSLGIVLSYPDSLNSTEARSRSVRLTPAASASATQATVGVIGAGNYGMAVLIPALKASNARLKTVVSSAGVSGLQAAKKFGFETASTDVDAMLADPEINAVVIATPHNSHSRLVEAALRAGKHVLVEKPLAITQEGHDQVLAARQASGAMLAVGFNRRFAPHIIKAKALVESANIPLSMVMTVNAGAIPLDHWIHDPQVGGTRLIGEACHFVDLLRFMAGSEIVSSAIVNMNSAGNDSFSITLGFANGSIGTVHYFANGDRSFPKERLEIFAGSAILQLDNFRVMRGFGWPKFKTMKLWRQDKGQVAAVQAFVDAVEGLATQPIADDELFEISQLCINLARDQHG
jgi:predicted dehydrogenase/NADPH:quinone reductase-like Zn-dependent oxidoreductase